MAQNKTDYGSIPVLFEQIKDAPINVIDDRFMPVKIWIAHTGENRNNSIFSKEVLESMIPSLTNIPILGYIAEDEETDKDFLAHEEHLVIEDNAFKLKYFGKAYGLIPHDNNARFEYRYGEDGVEREYLVCEGLIWRKFQDVIDIFERDGGYKNQSMELFRPSIQGEKNDEGVFVFTNAKFEGACLLGEDVTPAMVSSTIERFSFADTITDELKEMLTEFNALFSATKEKGDETVTINKDFTQEPATEPVNEPVAEPAAEPVQTEPEATPATFDGGEPAAEPTEPQAPAEPSEPAEPTEPAAEPTFAKKDEEDEDEDKDKEPKDGDEDEDEDEEKKKKAFTVTFALSHDDIRTGIYGALGQHEAFSDSWHYVSKVFDDHAIVEKEDDGTFYKVNYVKHEEAVELGEFEQIFPMWVNQSEQTALEMARTQFAALEEEVGTLRKFKADIELTEKEEMLSRYSESLSEDEYKTIKEGLVNFSVEQVEKEVGFLLLKKNHFSASTQSEPRTKVSATNTVESNPYGSASIYFQKLN